MIKHEKRIPMKWCFYPAIAFLLAAIAAPVFALTPAEHNRRGVQYGEQKMFDEALGEFNKSVGLYDRASAKVLHNRGWVLELKGLLDEAINSYEEAIRRNPGQIVSHERVGYLYYKSEKFDRAVESGEHVLKLDPGNRNVPVWLPDAYAKRLRERQKNLPAPAKVEREEAETSPQAADAGKSDDKQERKERRVLYATADFMIRYAYYTKGDDKGFQYEKDEGLLLNMPCGMYLNFTPVESFEFDVQAGNPYLGALSPNLAHFQERFQAIYHLGRYYLGLGLLVTHFQDDFVFAESETLHDYKAGIVFGTRQDRYEMRVLFYPRELPHDGRQSSGRTLDTDYLEYLMLYNVDRFLSFHVLLSVSDYYFFDHDLELSSYWGVYSAGMGITVNKYDGASNRKLVSVTLEFMLRLYLRDLENDRPYKFFNGQGWMGANSDTWFEGDPFSGFRTTGHVFSLRAEEVITKNVFLYQKLLFELAEGDEDTDHHDLALVIGAGVTL